MKFGRILIEGPDGTIPRLVLVLPEEGRVIDMKRASTALLTARGATHEAAVRMSEALFPGSMSAAIALGDYFLAAARRVDDARPDSSSLPIDSVTWAPASDPSVVRDGLTFKEHIKNFAKKMDVPIPPGILQLPGYAKGTPWTLFGHEAEIPWPEYIKYMDYELELGWVIGKRGHNVQPEDARSYLFGVTIFNDFSARDRQWTEASIGMGAQKSKDFAYGVGPWITTIDEFPDLDAIPMEVRVNGEVWGKGNSSGRIWSIEETIAYVSLADWIQPGDIIGSGTMGNGSAIELGRQLSPGDVVELEVGGVGILRNRMGQPTEKLWWPTEREPIV